MDYLTSGTLIFCLLGSIIFLPYAYLFGFDLSNVDLFFSNFSLLFPFSFSLVFFYGEAGALYKFSFMVSSLILSNLAKCSASWVASS